MWNSCSPSSSLHWKVCSSSALWLCIPTMHLARRRNLRHDDRFSHLRVPSSRWPCRYSLTNLFQAPATPPPWGEVSCTVLEITSHPFRNGLIDPEDKNAQDYARHCASESDPSGSLLAVPMLLCEACHISIDFLFFWSLNGLRLATLLRE